MHRFTIKRHVSLVLMLADECTDAVLRREVTVTAQNGRRKPVVKPDGYFVFTDIAEHTVTVDIRSLLYAPRTVTIDLTQLNPLRPFVKLRLMPALRYFPREATGVTGQTTPRRELAFVYECDKTAYKLLYDVKKNDASVQLYNPQNNDLEGSTFAIVGKNGTIDGIVRIGEKTEDGALLVQPVFAKAYAKMENVFIRVVETAADENGLFYCPIAGFSDKNKQILYYSDGLHAKAERTELAPKSMNTIALPTVKK